MKAQTEEKESKTGLETTAKEDGINTTGEVFDDIYIEDWDKAAEEFGIVPLNPDKYLLSFKSYKVTKTKKGEARAMITWEVLNDSNPNNNGRKIIDGIMLQGAGFGMALALGEKVGRKFSGKQQILTKDGRSPWLDTWAGCTVAADVGYATDPEGNINKDYNAVKKYYKV